MAKTIYLNLEDDVAKIIAKLKRERTAEAVLVFPKKSFIFSDSINLRLLKKQIDLLGTEVSILTMDERGQNYAKEAGFSLKHLPRTMRGQSVSDIRPRTAPVPRSVAPAAIIEEDIEEETEPEPAVRKPLRKPKPLVLKKKKLNTTVSSIQTTTTPIVPTPVRFNDNIFTTPDAKPAKARRSRSFKAYVVGFIALVLIVILLLVLVVLPSASITVYARTQSVARDIDILADVKASSPDSTRLTVPAVAVNETQTIRDDFQTNGKKEMGSKAEGRIAIYNLTGSPMNLKATTTTITVGSKSYTFKADVSNINALTSANNDSNATVADIVASEGGEGFNLPAGTRMEITNQAFGSQPQRLYAKTVTQVVGGTSRFISVLSNEDFTQAQSTLAKRVVEGINANLANRNVKLVEGAYSVNVVSFTPDKPEGTEAQSFTVEMQVTISGLAFDERGLKNMIRQRLISSIGAGKNLQELEKDTVVYRIKNLDVDNGLMQLALHYESNAKPGIEVTDLKNKIAGKTKQEASDLILANPDVDRVEITVQPVWQSGIPRFNSKIHLEVKE